MQLDVIARFEVSRRRLLADTRAMLTCPCGSSGSTKYHVQRNLAMDTDRLNLLDDPGPEPFNMATV